MDGVLSYSRCRSSQAVKRSWGILSLTICLLVGLGFFAHSFSHSHNHLSQRSANLVARSPAGWIYNKIQSEIQWRIDASELVIHDMSIREPDPTSYHIRLLSEVRAPGFIHKFATFKVKSFVGHLALAGAEPQVPFASVPYPETTVSGSTYSFVSQRVGIDNMEAFTAFSRALMQAETLNVTMTGRTKVQIKALFGKEYAVEFHKTMTLRGMNGFKGLEVVDPKVSLKSDAQGDNFHATVLLPNPSSVQYMEIGNVTFINTLNGMEVGTTSIDNLRLNMGPNEIPMRANVQQGIIIATLLSRPYCETGKLPFGLKAKSVINEGQTIPYFADSLAGSGQDVEINLADALRKMDPNFKIRCPP